MSRWPWIRLGGLIHLQRSYLCHSLHYSIPIIDQAHIMMLQLMSQFPILHQQGGLGPAPSTFTSNYEALLANGPAEPTKPGSNLLKAPGPPTPDPPRPGPLRPRPPPVPTPPPSPRSTLADNYHQAVTSTTVSSIASIICQRIIRPLSFPRPPRPPTPGPYRPGPVGPRPDVPTPPPSPRRSHKDRATYATVSTSAVLVPDPRPYPAPTKSTTGLIAFHYHVDKMSSSTGDQQPRGEAPGTENSSTTADSPRSQQSARYMGGDDVSTAATSSPSLSPSPPFAFTTRQPRPPNSYLGPLLIGPSYFYYEPAPLWACCELCEKGPAIRDQAPTKIILSSPSPTHAHPPFQAGRSRRTIIGENHPDPIPASAHTNNPGRQSNATFWLGANQ
ncbi:hypothetical protein F5Y16DRAFT_398110 [Xylariaceae sp. FL0255]|nr:hypothetical protein F5Y16DRAFT_398110 [Xylariaceae sp. FL0255]